jgi:hypothetical protein
MNAIRIIKISFLVMIIFHFPKGGGPCAQTINNLSPGESAIKKSSDLLKARPFKCGSAVSIQCFPDTAAFLSKIYPIDAEGCIELPLLGRKSISLMTKEELVDYLNTNFLKYLRNPGIQVRPLIRVALLGGFQRPGIYYIGQESSFSELLQLSGPPLREDGLQKMYWVRNRLPVDCDLVKSFESGKSLEEMGIQSGDQICVTPKPLLTSWDNFKTDILPIISLVVSTAVTSVTLFFTVQTYQQRR